MILTKVFRRHFHLNNKHSPHKLILVHQDYRNQLTEALARRICEELRRSHLHAHQTDMIVQSSQVHYNVVITERTLNDGILKLMHHKPKIAEEIHVSDLLKRITPQWSDST